MANDEQLTAAEKLELARAMAEELKQKKELAEVYMKAAEEGKLLNVVFDEQVKKLQESINLTEEHVDLLKGGATALATYALQNNKLIMTAMGFNKQMMEMMVRQRESGEEFNKLTGFSGQFNKTIADSVFANRDLGLTASENAAIYANLTKTFTDFTINGLSPTERGLVDAAALLQAVGIDSQTTAKSFQMLRKGFNQTDAEIVRSTLGLENFAEELGVTSDEIFSTFNEQIPTLAMFGSEAERVFKQTAAAAKSSGLEFTTMMSLFDLTDTFEGSANAAQSLNALLGGPFLNTVELTMAETPVERMQMLSDAFMDAGVSVDSLSRRQIQAFVEAVPGIENAIDLNKLLTGSFDELIDATDATGKKRAELVSEAERQRPLEENQKIIMDTLKGVDGIAQAFDDINRMAFVSAIDSAEKLRVVVADKLAPQLQKVQDRIADARTSLGLDEAGAVATETAALASMNQRDEAVRMGTGGERTVTINLMLNEEKLQEVILNLP
jgi:hypothetical protein